MSTNSLLRPDLAQPLAAASRERQDDIIDALLRFTFSKVPIHQAQDVLNAHGGRPVDSTLRESLLISARQAQAESLALLEKIEIAEDNDGRDCKLHDAGYVSGPGKTYQSANQCQAPSLARRTIVG